MTDSGIYHLPSHPPPRAAGELRRRPRLHAELPAAEQRQNAPGERSPRPAVASGGRGEPAARARLVPAAHCVAVNEARAPISASVAPRGPASPAYFPGTLTSRELFLRPLLRLPARSPGPAGGRALLLPSPAWGACARPGRPGTHHLRPGARRPVQPQPPASAPPPLPLVPALRSGDCYPGGGARVVAATSLHNPASQLFTQPGL